MVAARFLTIFLVLLPLALWGTLGESWNHWATIPAEFIIAFFLFGIEEVSSQSVYKVGYSVNRTLISGSHDLLDIIENFDMCMCMCT